MTTAVLVRCQECGETFTDIDEVTECRTKRHTQIMQDGQIIGSSPTCNYIYCGKCGSECPECERAKREQIKRRFINTVRQKMTRFMSDVMEGTTPSEELEVRFEQISRELFA